MKKLLLLSALLVFACSSSDDSDSSNSNGNSFNPPNWIQGVWLNNLIPTYDIGYEFRTDDICGVSGTQASCNKAIIELYEDVPNIQTNVYEEISNTRYYAVFTYGSSEITFDFEKISENEIRHIQGSSTSTILTKQ
tara:strand:- start:43 stop:450 length:408 start_codon:yes stop_codon:yes gene_type:complete